MTTEILQQHARARYAYLPEAKELSGLFDLLEQEDVAFVSATVDYLMPVRAFDPACGSGYIPFLLDQAGVTVIAGDADSETVNANNAVAKQIGSTIKFVNLDAIQHLKSADTRNTDTYVLSRFPHVNIGQGFTLEEYVVGNALQGRKNIALLPSLAGFGDELYAEMRLAALRRYEDVLLQQDYAVTVRPLLAESGFGSYCLLARPQE